MGTAILGRMSGVLEFGLRERGNGGRGWDGSALRLSSKRGNNALSPHIQ